MLILGLRKKLKKVYDYLKTDVYNLHIYRFIVYYWKYGLYQFINDKSRGGSRQSNRQPAGLTAKLAPN